MTKKLSTEDCGRAVVAAWKPEFGFDCDNWKRVKKLGKKGEPIGRVFYHRLLPLQALVWEKDGVITETIIKGLAVWDLDEKSTSYEDEAERLQCNDARAFIAQHQLFEPSDFVFHVLTAGESCDDEVNSYSITPVAYWKKHGCMLCDHMELYVSRFLPEGDTEIEEGTFETTLEPAQAEAELLKRGFIKDPEFDALFCRKGD